MALAGVQAGQDLAISRLFICPSVYHGVAVLQKVLTQRVDWVACVGAGGPGEHASLKGARDASDDDTCACNLHIHIIHTDSRR